METLIVGIFRKLTDFEIDFWEQMCKIVEGSTEEVFCEWAVKLLLYLEKHEKKCIKKKNRKLRILLKDCDVEGAIIRMREHEGYLEFKNDIYKFVDEINSDIPNVVNLNLIGSSFMSTINYSFSTDNSTLDNNSNLTPETPSTSEYHSGPCKTANNRYIGKFVSDNVVNLSNRNLSPSEISLLSKGLKFAPTPTGIDRAVLKAELETFGRKLRLKWHFRNSESITPINPFRRKSKFNPKGVDTAIEMYLSCLEEEILNLDTNLKYSNLTKEERIALQNLRNDNTIIIKEADKGSAVVVWDRQDYILEAERQLQDAEVYEECTKDIISPLISKIKSCLARVKERGDVSIETLDYFLVDNPKLGRFYLLPKIHKRMNNVPGRPVISNSGYYTENISAFLDYHLQPLVKSVKSYIKDTNDFLKKLKDLQTLPKDSLLCTVDVVGLYPNIPHKDGLEAVEKVLEGRSDKTISTALLMDLMECVLKNNVFEHDGRIFKQNQGTAIGTKMAPSYAILFMSEFEQKFLENYPLKPYVWWRYIDDIFIIWEHGEEKLKEFLEHLNKQHPTIKFTFDYSSIEINFLDVNVKKCGECLVTDLYIKPTDTHQYLQASSCHVYHCKRAIPYSQTLRLNRICSDTRLFDKRCNELESWLLKRGYNSKMVRNQILRARKFKRIDLLEKERTIRQEPDTVLNITYHPAFANIRSILEKIHILLTPNNEHRSVFQSIPVVGFKRAKSLKDILVRARVPPLVANNGKSETCGGKRCDVCNYICKTDEFCSHSENNAKTYKLRTPDLNCNSKCVVYLAECKVCNIQYVGSASTKFRLRFNNYKSAYRKYTSGHSVPQASFHAHFAQEGHHGMESWKFTLIDQAENVDSLRRKEAFWQNTLNTFQPVGLNEREVALF